MRRAVGGLAVPEPAPLKRRAASPLPLCASAVPPKKVSGWCRFFDHGLLGLHGFRSQRGHGFFNPTNPRNPWSIFLSLIGWLAVPPRSLASVFCKVTRTTLAFCARRAMLVALHRRVPTWSASPKAVLQPQPLEPRCPLLLRCYPLQRLQCLSIWLLMM